MDLYTYDLRTFITQIEDHLIASFIDILANIFKRTYRIAGLNINVGVK